MLKKYFLNWSKKEVRQGALILLGSISWCLTMVKSGLLYNFGLGFWGPNGHDGIWHIALAESLKKGTTDMPIFSGESIKNYHLGFDLLLATLSRITFLPTAFLYFQVLPVLFSVIIGFLVYRFVYNWTKSEKASLWSVFFIYFGGSLGYLVTLLKEGTIGGESLFWSQQAISTLVNPPFAMSLIFIFAGLLFLQKGIEENRNRYLALATFLFGCLIEIKVYAGLLVLTGLFVSGFWELVNRRGSRVFKVFTGALIISVLLFSSSSSQAVNSIVLRPFWFLESMFSATDRFYWPKMAEALANYKLEGNYLRLCIGYFVALMLFVAGNLGTRILGIVWLFRKIKDLRNLSYTEIFILTVFFAGIFIPTFFIQSGTPWNTIQFFYYTLVFGGIMTGITLNEFGTKKQKAFHIFFFTLTVLLTLPTTAGTLIYNYIPPRPPAKISNDELKALKYLKGQPDGIVLTLPFDRQLADIAISNPPRPLYLYESGAYVSAYSGKTTFLEDEVNLEITGYPWRERRQELEKYLQDKTDSAFLKEKNISYLYLVKPLNKYYGTKEGIEKIYSNDEVEIYKVR